MARNKLFGKATPRQIIRVLSIAFLLGIIVMLYQYKTYFAFLVAPMVIVSVVLTDYLHYQDSKQKKHTEKSDWNIFSNRLVQKSDTISTDIFQKIINLNQPIMKPIPTFTAAEYQLLRNLSKKSITSSNAKDMALLNGELDRAVIIKDGVIEKNIIRINSFVTIEDISAKRQMKFQIVLPSLANVKDNKVSILAPLSIAIIGFKENDVVEWELPAGTKTLKIVAVENLSDN